MSCNAIVLFVIVRSDFRSGNCQNELKIFSLLAKLMILRIKHTSQKRPLKRRRMLLRRDMKQFVFSERELTTTSKKLSFQLASEIFVRRSGLKSFRQLISVISFLKI